MPGARKARRPVSKWKLIALFWAVQSVALYVFPIALTANSWEELGERLVGVFDDEWFRIGIPWTVLLAVGQAAFLMPVSAPGARPPSRAGRWARHTTAGLAFGSIAGATALFVVPMVTMLVGTSWPNGLDAEELFWGVLIGVGLIATVVLRVGWRDRSPIGVTVAIAATCAAALLIGLCAAILELVERATGDEMSEGVLAAALLTPLVLSWAVGTPLLAAFLRRGGAEERAVRTGRLASRLFLGTMVELVAVIPLDVMVRRKTDCYCGEGTFWSLVLCFSVGFLTLGPGVWLLRVDRGRRRRLRGRCEACDYDMAGCPDAQRCPECGAGWRIG